VSLHGFDSKARLKEDTEAFAASSLLPKEHYMFLSEVRSCAQPPRAMDCAKDPAAPAASIPDQGRRPSQCPLT
jgi:hypothetical protein